jgi:2-methylcitrate dehydratase PrpD
VLSFTKKVKVVHDPEASEIFEKTPEKTFAKIELKAKGKVHVRKKEYCKGDPEMPMTKEDLRRKFKKLAGAILSKKRTDMLIRTIENLEYVDDISELTKLFRSQKKGKTGVNS